MDARQDENMTNDEIRVRAEADPRVIEAKARVTAKQLSRQRLKQIRARVREELGGGRPYRQTMGGSPKGQRRTCRVCGEVGHIAATCYRRQRARAASK